MHNPHQFLHAWYNFAVFRKEIHFLWTYLTILLAFSHYLCLDIFKLMPWYSSSLWQNMTIPIPHRQCKLHQNIYECGWSFAVHLFGSGVTPYFQGYSIYNCTIASEVTQRRGWINHTKLMRTIRLKKNSQTKYNKTDFTPCERLHLI